MPTIVIFPILFQECTQDVVEPLCQPFALRVIWAHGNMLHIYLQGHNVHQHILEFGPIICEDCHGRQVWHDDLVKDELGYELVVLENQWLEFHHFVKKLCMTMYL